MLIIGRDATAYAYAPAGADTAFALGSPIGIIGVWKTLKAEVSKEWMELTPSSASEPTKRRKINNWKATMENYVSGSGSGFLFTVLNNDLASVTFTECSTGKTIVAYGGIESAEVDYSSDSAIETMVLIDVGTDAFGGSVATFSYA